MKTSRYDFTMPPSLPGSRSSTGKGDKHDKAYYYYYVYRKKIDPNSITGPDDLPVPKHFRRDRLNVDSITGSLPRLNQFGSAGSSNSSRNGTPKRNGTVTIGKTHRRSNSLPELKNLRTSPKNRRNDYPRLQPLKGGKNSFSAPENRSRALPGIKKRGNNSASSSESSLSGMSIVKNPLAMSLFNLKPEDGLQWSRHTTISKGPNGR